MLFIAACFLQVTLNADGANISELLARTMQGPIASPQRSSSDSADRQKATGVNVTVTQNGTSAEAQTIAVVSPGPKGVSTDSQAKSAPSLEELLQVRTNSSPHVFSSEIKLSFYLPRNFFAHFASVLHSALLVTDRVFAPVDP